MSNQCPKCQQYALVWRKDLRSGHYACPTCGWCFTETYFYENGLPLPEKIRRKPELKT